MLRAVRRPLRERRAEQRLLHGVTGSGKTEVYLRAAEAALEQGRGAIVLVPEIALTPQIVGRFVERFGDTVAVLHSRLRPAERYAEWRRLREGEARVCVGPRSAVFAPIEDLGLIVVDEEHDASYKHEGDPRYDARDVAAERAERCGAVLLLGSATPRPGERAAPARQLRCRPRRRRPLPPVDVLDMRGETQGLHPLTAQALADVRARAARRSCCSTAAAGRTSSRAALRARVELSGLRRRARAAPRRRLSRLPPLRASRARARALLATARSTAVARHGAGTERLQHELAHGARRRSLPRLSPRRRRGRSPREDSGVGAILRRFEAAPCGVLIGTQMVAKGHDFPDVSSGSCSTPTPRCASPTSAPRSARSR
jgi:primosomal protein N' (replication factor Y)